MTTQAEMKIFSSLTSAIQKELDLGLTRHSLFSFFVSGWKQKRREPCDFKVCDRSWDEIGQDFYNDLYKRTGSPRNTQEKKMLLSFVDYIKAHCRAS